MYARAIVMRTTSGPGAQAPPRPAAPPERPYLLERIGEAAVVQLYADGFRDLALNEKILVWHLYQAALAGRHIFYYQRDPPKLQLPDRLGAIVLRPPPIH